MARGRDSSAYRRFPPGFALMPEDFPQKLAAIKELAGLTWEGMSDALGVAPPTLALAPAGRRTQRRGHAVPDAPGGPGAGLPSPAPGRRREYNSQTEEVTA